MDLEALSPTRIETLAQKGFCFFWCGVDAGGLVSVFRVCKISFVKKVSRGSFMNGVLGVNLQIDMI